MPVSGWPSMLSIPDDGAQQPEQHARQRGLAAAGFADEPHDLALPDRQVDAVDRVERLLRAHEALRDEEHARDVDGFEHRRGSRSARASCQRSSPRAAPGRAGTAPPVSSSAADAAHRVGGPRAGRQLDRRGAARVDDGNAAVRRSGSPACGRRATAPCRGWCRGARRACVLPGIGMQASSPRV